MAPHDRTRTTRLTRSLLNTTRRLNEVLQTRPRPLDGSGYAVTEPAVGAQRGQKRWDDTTQEIGINLDSRVLLLLLLDTSNSMKTSAKNTTGPTPISQLNAGLHALRDALMRDADARRRVEVAILTFGDVPRIRNLRSGGGTVTNMHEAFVSARDFSPPELSADGLTPMAAAMDEALRIVQARKDFHNRERIPYFRPWVMLISDGAPTDEQDAWRRAVRAMHEAQKSGQAVLYPIGVENADMKRLDGLIWNDPADPDSHYSAMSLKELQFESLFRWLSASIRDTLNSAQDDAPTVLSRKRMWDQRDVS